MRRKGREREMAFWKNREKKASGDAVNYLEKIKNWESERQVIA